MIERIEHFRAELQFEPLSDREILLNPKINVPVARRNEDVATCAILTWRGNRKSAVVGKHYRADNALTSCSSTSGLTPPMMKGLG